MTKPVTIYPTGSHYIPGVPAVEQEVSTTRAEELLAYEPAAFTTKPSRSKQTQLYVPQWAEPDEPDEPDTNPTGPADAGPLDSTEA